MRVDLKILTDIHFIHEDNTHSDFIPDLLEIAMEHQLNSKIFDKLGKNQWIKNEIQNCEVEIPECINCFSRLLYLFRSDFDDVDSNYSIIHDFFSYLNLPMLFKLNQALFLVKFMKELLFIAMAIRNHFQFLHLDI